MRFFYDSTGKRVSFANGAMLFYYLYNVQGDVIAIVRAATGQYEYPIVKSSKSSSSNRYIWSWNTGRLYT